MGLLTAHSCADRWDGLMTTVFLALWCRLPLLTFALFLGKSRKSILETTALKILHWRNHKWWGWRCCCRRPASVQSRCRYWWPAVHLRQINIIWEHHQGPQGQPGENEKQSHGQEHLNDLLLLLGYHVSLLLVLSCQWGTFLLNSEIPILPYI